MAHTKAGSYLAERSRELEAEVDSSKRALALALSQDRADRGSSELASVLANIGFSEWEQSADVSGDSGVDEFHGAMMRSEISSRRGVRDVVVLNDMVRQTPGWLIIDFATLPPLDAAS